MTAHSAPAADPAPASAVFSRRLVRMLAVAAWLAVLWPLTALVARVYPVSSDDATGLLEASAVLSGNVLLRGWTLSASSFATIDLPFYMAGVAMLGPRPSLLRDVPVTIYLATVVAAVLLARGARGPGGRVALGVLAVLVLLGLPAGRFAELATKGYIRVGTTLGLFAALLALDVPAGRRVSAARLAIFGALLTLTFLSDPYALFVAGPAFVLVCMLGAVRANPYRSLDVGRVAATVVGAVLAAQGASWLIEGLGGYHVLPYGLFQSRARHTLLRGAIRNAVTLGAGLPGLYRCDLPAGTTARAIALWLGCLPGLGLVVFALVRGCPISLRGRHTTHDRPADFVADVLWVLAVLAVAAYLINTPSDDPATMRYLIPFVLAGVALTGRVLADRIHNATLPIAALGLLGLAYAVTAYEDVHRPRAIDRAKDLAQWLVAHGQRHGYGPFWDASIVTVFGEGRVAVRPVRARTVAADTHRFEPLRWMADERWYSEGPATFVVYEPPPAANPQFGIDRRTCSMSFGPPESYNRVGPYTVLIWRHDLRPLLNQDSRVEWDPARRDVSPRK